MAIQISTASLSMMISATNNDIEEKILGGELDLSVNMDKYGGDQFLIDDLGFHNPFQNSEDFVSKLNHGFEQVDRYSEGFSNDEDFSSTVGQAIDDDAYSKDYQHRGHQLRSSLSRTLVCIKSC